MKLSLVGDVKFNRRGERTNARRNIGGVCLK